MFNRKDKTSKDKVELSFVRADTVTYKDYVINVRLHTQNKEGALTECVVDCTLYETLKSRKSSEDTIEHINSVHETFLIVATNDDSYNKAILYYEKLFKKYVDLMHCYIDYLNEFDYKMTYSSYVDFIDYIEKTDVETYSYYEKEFIWFRSKAMIDSIESMKKSKEETEEPREELDDFDDMYCVDSYNTKDEEVNSNNHTVNTILSSIELRMKTDELCEKLERESGEVSNKIAEYKSHIMHDFPLYCMELNLECSKEGKYYNAISKTHYQFYVSNVFCEKYTDGEMSMDVYNKLTNNEFMSKVFKNTVKEFKKNAYKVLSKSDSENGNLTEEFTIFW